MKRQQQRRSRILGVRAVFVVGAVLVGSAMSGCWYAAAAGAGAGVGYVVGKESK